MKRSLAFSLLVNAGLTGVLIFTMLRPNGPAPMVVAMTGPPLEEQIATAPRNPVPNVQVNPKPFHWSQLEATDYHIYVKNLRAIGCPEPTLRAIVTADVDAVYRQRSEALAQKLDALSSGSWKVQLTSYQEQQALKVEMGQLPDQEHADICDMLGLKPAPVPAAAAPPGSPENRSPQRPLRLPLVMKSLDLAALRSTTIKIPR